jgi:hypothetical protein
MKWLSDMDSNHDKSLQRALCYRYTIGQTEMKLAGRERKRKENFSGFYEKLVQFLPEFNR